MNFPAHNLALFRIPLALTTAASAAASGLILSRSPTITVGASFLGVFLLACGASALNQMQERDLDSAMERTRKRPIPAGAVSLRAATALALFALSAGVCTLLAAGLPSLLLGLFALVWYNGLYTPLKRRTAFASLFGALVGAIPPAIGWTAAGGTLLDPRLFALSMLLLLWQVPHFWQLLLDREQDYRQAGLPVFTDILPAARLKRIVFLWTAATSVVPLLLPLYGIVRSTPAAWSILALVLFMTIQAFRAGFGAGKASFYWINAFLAAVLVVISLDAVLPGALQ